jgi:predicted nicotinamide N-methyase
MALVATSLALALAGGPPVRARCVQVTPELELSVYELSSPGELVQQHWLGKSAGGADPFGTVLWPGALFASRRLCANADNVRGRTILCLGTGTGLEVLTAASLGARRVIACDLNPLTLGLLADAAKDAGFGGIVETRVFDLCSKEPLPEADVHVYADVLYTRLLSLAIAKRCRAMLRGELPEQGESADGGGNRDGEGAPRPGWLLLTDSQRFHSEPFLEELNLESEGADAPGPFAWAEESLERFTGSGILLDEDQTYSSEIRFLDLRV